MRVCSPIWSTSLLLHYLWKCLFMSSWIHIIQVALLCWCIKLVYVEMLVPVITWWYSVSCYSEVNKDTIDFYALFSRLLCCLSPLYSSFSCASPSLSISLSLSLVLYSRMTACHKLHLIPDTPSGSTNQGQSFRPQPCNGAPPQPAHALTQRWWFSCKNNTSDFERKCQNTCMHPAYVFFFFRQNLILSFGKQMTAISLWFTPAFDLADVCLCVIYTQRHRYQTWIY